MSQIPESPFKTKLLIPHATHLSVHSIDPNTDLTKAPTRINSHDSQYYFSPMKAFRPHGLKETSASDFRLSSTGANFKSQSSSKDRIKQHEIRVLELVESDYIDDAKTLMEDCLKLVKQVYDEYDLENIYALYLYADILTRSGDIDNAIHFCEKSLKIIEELPPHVEKGAIIIQYQATILYMISLLYNKTSQPLKGIICLQNLIRTLEKYKLESVDLITVKISLGNAYMEAHKYIEAQRVLEFCKNQFPSNSQNYHQILIKICQCAMSLNQLATATGYLNEAKAYLHFLDDKDKYTVLSSLS